VLVFPVGSNTRLQNGTKTGTLEVDNSVESGAKVCRLPLTGVQLLGHARLPVLAVLGLVGLVQLLLEQIS
jgi:hypothetical protein